MITDYNRQTVIQKPSRFVTEVPPELYDIWTLEEESAQSLSAAPDDEESETDGYIH